MQEKKLKTLSDRLSYALDKLAVSQAELARKINVKRQAVQYLCASGTNKTRFAYDIAEALDINVDWLVTGVGEMLLQETPEERLLAQHKIVPVLAWIQIKSWLKGEIKKNDIDNWTTVHKKFSDNSFALRLKDNSMRPMFEAETIVVVDPQVTPSPPCFVIAYIQRTQDFVCRQLLKENDKLVLCPSNQVGYNNVFLDEDDKIVGSIVEARWST